MMKQLLFIFFGGGVGSILRFLLSQATQKWWTIQSFPMGTFIVNMLGCFGIGLFSAYFLKNPSDLKFLLIAGFCGGFTTFSTFSLEGLQLFQQQQYGTLICYFLLSLFLGLFLTYIGFMLNR